MELEPMGKDVPERSSNHCLATIENYRKMQINLYAMKKTNAQSDKSGKSEEWKNWELAPLDAPVKPVTGNRAGAEGKDEALAPEHSSEAVKGVHKALRQIDKY